MNHESPLIFGAGIQQVNATAPAPRLDYNLRRR